MKTKSTVSQCQNVIRGKHWRIWGKLTSQRRVENDKLSRCRCRWIVLAVHFFLSVISILISLKNHVGLPIIVLLRMLISKYI